MNKTKKRHTDGPWYFCCDSGHSTKCLRGVQHSKKAAVHSGKGDIRPTIASHVGNWADARLIAAAPDLIDAIIPLLSIVKAELAEDPEPEDLTSWHRAIADAETAIKKVEGS